MACRPTVTVDSQICGTLQGRTKGGGVGVKKNP